MRLSQRGGQALHFCAGNRFPPSRRLEWPLSAPSGQPPRHARPPKGYTRRFK